MIPKNTKMPLLFIGHGSPMNALANNDYTQALNQIARLIPQPKAILCVSAHWLTTGTFVTSSAQPKIIYDFYGFPEALYKINYPAPGSEKIAALIQNCMSIPTIQSDKGSWGLDHGTWAVLKHIYPQADIPTLQLSIDATQPAAYHFELGQKLSELREHEILIIGSGNIVHNLGNFSWNENEPAFNWATEFDQWTREQLKTRNHRSLIEDYLNTNAGRLSVPTPDHYLPLLYVLGASYPEDNLKFIYEKIHHGSIAMRSFILS